MIDVTFISDFRKKLTNMSLSLRGYSAYFKALALADCYNYMIQLIEDRTSTHPEVIRVPELRSILVKHFIDNYALHIDVQQDRIFNPNLLGSGFVLRQWQEAGYRTRSKRTTRNYFQRLRYWKSIYDNEPIRVNLDVSNQAMGTATLKKRKYPLPRTGDDLFGDLQQKLFYEIRVKDRSGNIVTYEDVIKKRNAGFGSSVYKLIPFWIPLNYGSDAGMQAGYPAIPGLHFIEDAERTIPQRLSQMADHLPDFALYLLDLESTQKDFSVVQNWTSSHISLTKGPLDAHAVAIDIAYGLPF